MRAPYKAIVLICLCLLTPPSAQAVTLFLDKGDVTSGVLNGPVTGDNPTVYVSTGNTTELHLWALPDTDANKTVVSIGIHIVASGAGSSDLSALQFEFDNPLLTSGQRWSGTALTGGLNVDGKLVSDQRAVYIPLTLPAPAGGLSSATTATDPGVDSNTGAVHLGKLVLNANPGAALGPVELRLVVSPLLITSLQSSGAAPPELVFFGYANSAPELATAGGTQNNSTSATADATVVIRRLGDSDGDGDVDLIDYAAFAECMNGPNQPPLQPTGCLESFDADQDSDVDLNDADAFTREFQ
ncbi:MAG TPA: hypothetical protein PKN33_02675 [Phycisphaerae bacterium]|nr:hypothetical protein [Phycisphaerae bacterium]